MAEGYSREGWRTRKSLRCLASGGRSLRCPRAGWRRVLQARHGPCVSFWARMARRVRGLRASESLGEYHLPASQHDLRSVGVTVTCELEWRA